MRKFRIGIAAVLFAAAPASAGVDYHMQVTGSGAGTTVFSISDDSCVETSGEVRGLSTNEGKFVYVNVDRVDYCAEDGPIAWKYFAIEPVTMSVRGLSSATMHGSVVASPFFSPPGPDITLDFSLAFTGKGPVTVSKEFFRSAEPDAITLSFSIGLQRAAKVAGSVSIDGEDVALSNSVIVAGTEGDLVIHR